VGSSARGFAQLLPAPRLTSSARQAALRFWSRSNSRQRSAAGRARLECPRESRAQPSRSAKRARKHGRRERRPQPALDECFTHSRARFKVRRALRPHLPPRQHGLPGSGARPSGPSRAKRFRLQNCPGMNPSPNDNCECNGAVYVFEVQRLRGRPRPPTLGHSAPGRHRQRRCARSDRAQPSPAERFTRTRVQLRSPSRS